MSNYKQSMKLYTEEQMRDAIKMARNGVRSEDNIIGSLNFIKPPIELPSDEEIDEETLEETALSFLPHSEVEHDTCFIIGFEFGFKYVLNKIQGGNNEQQ